MDHQVLLSKNLLNNKIIGIHKQGSSKLQKNFGTFLKYPINEYINKHLINNKIINNDNLVNKNEIKTTLEKKTISKNISHIFI